MFFVRVFGADCTLSLGPEEAAPPRPAPSSPLMQVSGQDSGRTGCFRNGEGPFWLLHCRVGQPFPFLLTGASGLRPPHPAPAGDRHKVTGTCWHERMCVTAPLWVLCVHLRLLHVSLACVCVRMCAHQPLIGLSATCNLDLDRLLAPWNRDFLNPSGPVTGSSAVFSECGGTGASAGSDFLERNLVYTTALLSVVR